jgi:hypothetical protein
LIPESRMREYNNCMKLAFELAVLHDKVFFVYDMDGKYHATSDRHADRKMLGEVFPGGMTRAWGLVPNKAGDVRL